MAVLAEVRTRVQRYPRVLEQPGCRIVAETVRTKIQPCEIGGLWHRHSRVGELCCHTGGEVVTLLDEEPHGLRKPRLALCERCERGRRTRRGDSAEQVVWQRCHACVDTGIADVAHGTAQASDVERLASGCRGHNAHALGSRQRLERDMAGAWKHDVGPYLITDDEQIVAAGDLGHSRELLSGERATRGIMRVAHQDRRDATAAVNGAGDRSLEPLRVDMPRTRIERAVDRTATRTADAAEERWIDGRQKHHAVIRLRAGPQRKLHGLQYVSEEPQALRTGAPPVTSREPRVPRLGQRVRRTERIAEVAPVNDGAHRLGHDGCRREVHIGDPTRKNVGRIA